TAELRTVGADIEAKLGLPVKLTGSLNRRRIELRYSSREEKERVCAKLLSQSSWPPHNRARPKPHPPPAPALPHCCAKSPRWSCSRSSFTSASASQSRPSTSRAF